MLHQNYFLSVVILLSCNMHGKIWLYVLCTINENKTDKSQDMITNFCKITDDLSFLFYNFQVFNISTTKFIYFTVVCKIVHKFASVWCKTALGEVGMSLPWWCAALVLLAPGYWSFFLNLKNLFIMEKWPLVIFP